MTTIGYHASHEQFPPERLLAWSGDALRAGFGAVMCSDHFHPWSRAQGQSGHAWSWLGAMMASCTASCGVVTSPVGRYHPAVIAQAAATLARMFPGRFWLAVGSGEALNESITGQPWPDKSARNRRLGEAVQVMRALWAGQTVDHDGGFRLRHARLYTRPEHPPAVLLAALSADTARWGAAWADGLITVATPEAPVAAILRAFREGGGAGKPIHLQVKLSYAADEDAALRGAFEQWRSNAVSRRESETLDTPEAFERCAAKITPADVARVVHVSADPDRHRAWLETYLRCGADHLHLHNVNRDQDAFIRVFGRDVIRHIT